MKKKTVALLLVLVLAIGCGVGGTVAWLLDQTQTVNNTFTPSTISITLTETDYDNDNNANANSFKMVPGHTIDKDPEVSVAAGSEPCYLFVKVEEQNSFRSFMEYSIADGWTKVPGTENVYYRVVANGDNDSNAITDATAANATYPVLAGDVVTVKQTVRKQDMPTSAASYPKLSVTAYATQLYNSNNEKFEVAEAWTLASAQN